MHFIKRWLIGASARRLLVNGFTHRARVFVLYFVIVCAVEWVRNETVAIVQAPKRDFVEQSIAKHRAHITKINVPWLARRLLEFICLHPFSAIYEWDKIWFDINHLFAIALARVCSFIVDLARLTFDTNTGSDKFHICENVFSRQFGMCKTNINHLRSIVYLRIVI